jgi:hypothetical protein
LQDIELAQISQEVTERFYNLSAVSEGGRCPSRVIRVGPTGSKASPNVRYAFNGDRICAPQRTDAKCQEATYAPQQTAPYSITSSARARVRLGLED